MTEADLIIQKVNLIKAYTYGMSTVNRLLDEIVDDVCQLEKKAYFQIRIPKFLQRR